jgi:preprotein translocase subunit SecA
MVAYPETLPCQCVNPACGIRFEMPNFLGNIGAHSVFSNNSTSCPKCKRQARILDFTTDGKGKAHYQQLFNFVRNISDRDSLNRVKEELEAANDSLVAKELAENLERIEPGFAQFKTLIESAPVKSLPTLINILLTIILLVLTYQGLVSDDEHHEESIDIQRKQFELDREEFEYQKERDSLKDRKIKDLEKQIRELREKFEQELVPAENNRQPHKSTKKEMKGCERNKPCPCGSGRKYKKCHPNGMLV